MPENPQIILATRLQRIIATLIDCTSPIVIIYTVLYVASQGASSGSPETSIIGTAITFIYGVIPALLLLLLTNLILLHKRSQTIGKAIMHIKIVRAHFYTPASTLSILATYLLLFLILFIPYYIGPLIFLINTLFIFTPKKRYLHELFADINLIKVSPQ